MQDLFNSELQVVDVEYDQNVVHKQFDVNSAEVQNLMSRYIGVLGMDSVTKQS